MQYYYVIYSLYLQFPNNPNNAPERYIYIFLSIYPSFYLDFPGGLAVKNLPANAGDVGLISELGRSPGEGSGNPLQYYCLENPMDGGAWEATVHGVAKSQTRLSDFTIVTIPWLLR